MNSASAKTPVEIEINWSAFASINKFIVMAHPTGVFLLTSTLDTVWSPVMGQA